MPMRRTFQLLLAVAVTSVALVLGSAAGAVPNPDYTAPAPVSVAQNPQPPVAGRAASPQADRGAASPQAVRRAAAPSAPTRQQLAITGSDAVQIAVIGGVLLALGAGTMVIRRRSLA